MESHEVLEKGGEVGASSLQVAAQATQGFSMDWISAVVSLVAALIGGAIAGYFSLLATKKSHDHALERQRIEETDQINALLDGFHDEIETLWQIYMDGGGVLLEALPDGEHIGFYYTANQDYFTLYRENAYLLGKIKNPDLRKK